MKRFTATEKWDDSWFRKLPPEQKCFWDFICTRCDCAGVWKVDLEAAEFFIGAKLDLHTLTVAFGKRIRILSEGKWWITQFVEFQYGRLSRECKPHLPIFKALEHHGISLETLGKSVVEQNSETLKPNTLGEALANPSVRVQEKDKEKEKDKEGGESEGRGQPEDIYLEYPKKVAKPDALRAIKKAITKVGFQDLMERTRMYAGAVASMDPKYIPHPATWFNRESYNDDPKEWNPDKTNGNTNKPNARNFGIAGDQAERTRRVLDALERKKAERAAASNGMAAAQPANGCHPPNGAGGG